MRAHFDTHKWKMEYTLCLLTRVCNFYWAQHICSCLTTAALTVTVDEVPDSIRQWLTDWKWDKMNGGRNRPRGASITDQTSVTVQKYHVLHLNEVQCTNSLTISMIFNLDNVFNLELTLRCPDKSQLLCQIKEYTWIRTPWGNKMWSHFPLQ